VFSIPLHENYPLKIKKGKTINRLLKLKYSYSTLSVNKKLDDGGISPLNQQHLNMIIFDSKLKLLFSRCHISFINAYLLFLLK
jgi:hypothetical protein